jgi:hypothetical protein
MNSVNKDGVLKRFRTLHLINDKDLQITLHVGSYQRQFIYGYEYSIKGSILEAAHGGFYPNVNATNRYYSNAATCERAAVARLIDYFMTIHRQYPRLNHCDVALNVLRSYQPKAVKIPQSIFDYE